MEYFSVILVVVLCFLGLACFFSTDQSKKKKIHRKKNEIKRKDFYQKSFEFLDKNHTYLLFALLLLGIVIRFAGFWLVPDGLNQDEASIGYDIWANLIHGMDRNGYHNPVYSVAWGSGHSSLYIALSKPFIAIFGLSVFSVRLVNVIFGSSALIFLYLTGKKLRGKNFGLLLLFLIAINPWHIMMSRWALECNLLPNVLLIAVYFIIRAEDKKRNFIFGMILAGISLYAYGTSYIVVPVIILFSSIYFLKNKIITLKILLLGYGCLLVTALPLIVFMAINILDLEPIVLPFLSFPKLISGRYNSTVTVLGGNFLQNISVNMKNMWHIIVKQDDGLIWNSIPKYGTIYLFSLAFVIIGLIRMIFEKKKSGEIVLLSWLVGSLLLSVLVSVNINRINSIYIPLIYLCALGIDFVARNLKYCMVAIIALYLSWFSSFCCYYFTDFRSEIGQHFFKGAGQAILYATELTQGDIYLSSVINQPYIIAMFYEKTEPALFINTVKYINPDSECRFVQSFGRYITGIPERITDYNSVYVIHDSEAGGFDEELFNVKTFDYYHVIWRK